MPQPIQLLLIEDNRDAAFLIRKLLEEIKPGAFHITHVERLAAGFKHVSAQPVDAILLDLSLPDSTGLETLTRVRAHQPSAPIIVMTSLDDETIALEAVRQGAQDYLIKGRSDGELIARAIRYAIERTRAEETLRVSEERFRSILDNIEDGYYEVDTAGNFTFFNPALVRMLGRPANELMGMNNRVYMTPEAAKAVFQTFNRVFRTGIPEQSFDWEWIRPDGAHRFAEVSVSLLKAVDGSVQGFRGIIRDITERKRVEEALRHSRDLLNQTQRLAKIGGWEWDVVEQTMTWTDETYRIHGFSPGEVAAGSPEHIERSLACYDPDDRPVIKAAFQRCAEEGQPYDMAFPLTTVDGRRIWIQTVAYPVKHNNRIVAVIGNIVDITERKRVEEALRHSRDLLNQTQRLAKVGGWEWDVVEQTMTWTDETYRIHGFSPGEVAAGSPEHIERSLACYDPDDRPVIKAAFQRCAEEGQPYDMAFPLTTVDGRRIWIQTVAYPVKHNNRIVAVIGNIVDITERKRAEESLRVLSARQESLLGAIPDIVMDSSLD